MLRGTAVGTCIETFGGESSGRDLVDRGYPKESYEVFDGESDLVARISRWVGGDTDCVAAGSPII